MSRKTDHHAQVQGNTALALTGGPHLRLSTLTQTRKSLARVVRMYARMELPREYFKALVHGLNSLVAAWRTEYELVDVQRQIDEIRGMLREVEREKK